MKRLLSSRKPADLLWISTLASAVVALGFQVLTALSWNLPDSQRLPFTTKAPGFAVILLGILAGRGRTPLQQRTCSQSLARVSPRSPPQASRSSRHLHPLLVPSGRRLHRHYRHAHRQIARRHLPLSPNVNPPPPSLHRRRPQEPMTAGIGGNALSRQASVVQPLGRHTPHLHRCNRRQRQQPSAETTPPLTAQPPPDPTVQSLP